jgi:hypothetical protein
VALDTRDGLVVLTQLDREVVVRFRQPVRSQLRGSYDVGSRDEGYRGYGVSLVLDEHRERPHAVTLPREREREMSLSRQIAKKSKPTMANQRTPFIKRQHHLGRDR